MINSVQQINDLINMLLIFDDNPNQPTSLQKQLYNNSLSMINNPDIYGDVRDIVVKLHKEIKVDDQFNVDIPPDTPFGLYAADLCEYLPIE